MSTQGMFKYRIGDAVRVTNYKNGADGMGYSGDPEGMTGHISEIESTQSMAAWPYKVALEGRSPARDYPDFFAEDELELVDAPSPAMPGIVSTEWGVRSPWGDTAADNFKMAHQIATNMREAGHEASVVWRGITEWQVKA